MNRCIRKPKTLFLSHVFMADKSNVTHKEQASSYQACEEPCYTIPARITRHGRLSAYRSCISLCNMSRTFIYLSVHFQHLTQCLVSDNTGGPLWAASVIYYL